ncbi:MAG: D-tyrosyl-tRNA(Tyr) deacylase [Proteobacteria bacterium]|nr:D-tyrosyl-tRNA(Tyr) deacylase [Pseudomonadota bacterium]MBU4297092.1 D-tyrosyl-tRNA(Tyr) deacylase [Pseudomonadota bacterium]MCG2747412.1 D-aminoacyl-tRNA deacylase [Desulfobulbaceae bacterium]
MRAVVQLVKKASVTIEKKTSGAIGPGLLVLLGVARSDTIKDVEYMVDKILNLRIFPDKEGKMNLSVRDIGGEILVVSQFTLFGDCRKGRRPSYSHAAPPEAADQLYRSFVASMGKYLRVATGTFQAMMEVELINDGPVTLLIDSNKEF